MRDTRGVLLVLVALVAAPVLVAAPAVAQKNPMATRSAVTRTPGALAMRLNVDMTSRRLLRLKEIVVGRSPRSPR